MNKSKAKTSVIKKDLNPVWDETLTMNGVTTDNIDTLYFHLEVINLDFLGKLFHSGSDVRHSLLNFYFLAPFCSVPRSTPDV